MDPESQPVTLADLERWFSVERMDTYVQSAQATGCDVVDLYVWNGRVSKALLEDVAHVEVLLRNFMSVRLAKACGHDDWYKDDARFRFNSSKARRFESSIDEIERQIRYSRKPVTPGRVIADMSLGSWCFLLSSRLEQTVWKALRDPANGGMPNYPSRKRLVFESHVKTMRDLRNRLSHQRSTSCLTTLPMSSAIWMSSTPISTGSTAPSTRRPPTGYTANHEWRHYAQDVLSFDYPVIASHSTGEHPRRLADTAGTQ